MASETTRPAAEMTDRQMLAVAARDKSWCYSAAVTELMAENKRLRKFVQFVADCSNDPRVVDEAIKMGART